MIIPAYNAREFVKSSLDSVLAQDFDDFEIVVVDDGSTDGTSDVLREYGGLIIWKSQQNRGQAFALNEGLRIASGQYIALLDADDMALRERLRIQVKILEENPEVALVYSDRYQIDREGHVAGVIPSRPFDKFKLLQRNFIPRSSVMIRRQILDVVGDFDQGNSGNDDWDMWVRISESASLLHIPQPLIQYRIHDKNISLTRPKRLDFYRWTRLTMLKSVRNRNGRSWWLDIMVGRAWVVWRLGAISPEFGEKYPRLWSRIDRVLELVETLFIRSALLGRGLRYG